MGVDVKIKPESLVVCQQAQCRVYRPSFPDKGIAFMGANMNEPGYRILPVEFLPLAYRLQSGEIRMQKTSSPSQYAARIKVIPDKSSFEPPQFLFEDWVTENEFLELKAHISPGGRETWEKLNFEERSEICKHCPLKLYDWDCEPHLFGYGSLPALRRAARQLFANPPDLIRAEIDELLVRFRLIFQLSQTEPTATGQKTLEAEQRARWLAIQVQAEDAHLIIGGSIVERPLDTGLATSEEIFDLLFFRESEGGEMNYLSGRQLADLASWLEAFLRVLTKLKESQLFDDDLKTLFDVFGTYFTACQNASKFNLEFSVSS